MLVEARTKLPLYRWGQLMGLHPLHFAQVTLPIQSLPMACSTAWYRHNWQDADRTGREEVAAAIYRAETDLEQYLGYNLVPDWTVDERVHVGRTYTPEHVAYPSINARGYPSTVIAGRKHFVAAGIRASTLIAASRPVVYTDADSDLYFETATVTATVATGQAACEVRAYYPGKDGADAYEIRPVRVTVVGTTATIVFRREQAVLEARQDAMNPISVDGLDNAQFLTTVDVYRVYNDPQTQVSFLWEQLGQCGCLNADCTVCQYSAQTGCLVARDNKHSILAFSPSSWDAATSLFSSAAWGMSRTPDVARLYYLSGLQDNALACPRVEMNRDWAMTVAIYAASMLERPLCDCAASVRVENWREEVSFTGGVKELATYNISFNDLENPFGTRRGALYAWRRVSRPNATIGTGAVYVS